MKLAHPCELDKIRAKGNVQENEKKSSEVVSKGKIRVKGHFKGISTKRKWLIIRVAPEG